MDAARLVFAVPDDPDVLDKLRAAVAAQADPPIAVERPAAAVLAFECATWDMILRSRVMLGLRRRPRARMAAARDAHRVAPMAA
jgi:hypothetical protein